MFLLLFESLNLWQSCTHFFNFGQLILSALLSFAVSQQQHCLKVSSFILESKCKQATANRLLVVEFFAYLFTSQVGKWEKIDRNFNCEVRTRVYQLASQIEQVGERKINRLASEREWLSFGSMDFQFLFQEQTSSQVGKQANTHAQQVSILPMAR